VGEDKGRLMIRGLIEWFSDPANFSGEDGVWNRLLEHSLLTVTATVVAVAIGLPIAVWLGHIGRGGVLAVNVSNVGRAVPTFAVLLLLSVGPIGADRLGAYGRAGLATLIALVLFALPPIITNAYVGMREVDRDTVEAARGMGMRGRSGRLRRSPRWWPVPAWAGSSRSASDAKTWSRSSPGR